MEAIVQLNSPREHAPKRSRKKQSTVPPRVRTQFAYPKGIKGCAIKWSRKGRKLIEAMNAYVKPRLLPKLQARTAGRPDCNRHDAIDVEFLDASATDSAWLFEAT